MRRVLLVMQFALRAPSRIPRMAVVLGRWLGTAFVVCFLTGLYSHFLQQPAPWMRFQTHPYWLYQVTQGVHITAGIVCFPLILGKLYAVLPNLFQTPVIRGVRHLLERATVALFVAASLVELVILLNTLQWYVFPFGFKQVHFALAFVIVGALMIHIAVKLPVIRRYWRRRSSHDKTGQLNLAAADEPELRMSRRGFLATIAMSAAALVALTAGQSFAVLNRLNAFAPRKMGIGPAGLPINRTAHAAQVTATAVGPDWVLTIRRRDTVRTFTRAELLALPQAIEILPIACVEGWSQSATWRGVRLADLMQQVGRIDGEGLRLTSLERQGNYRQTAMGAEYVEDRRTLVALELNGQPLDLDHGYPARMIAPGRPGVLQTKWLDTIEVV